MKVLFASFFKLNDMKEWVYFYFYPTIFKPIMVKELQKQACYFVGIIYLIESLG